MTNPNHPGVRLPLLASLLLGGLASSPFAQNFEPADAVDLDPDPTVIEIDLTAAESTWQFTPGVDTTVWAYNGQVPGPTIRANVGDLLKVHFTNDLDEPTTIHWHGLEIPADQDGAHIAQHPVQPGETFEYEFIIPDAGLYWYHPHVRTHDQVERGLHGVLLVHDPAVEGPLGLLDLDETIVVFDDILVDENEQVVAPLASTDPLVNALDQLNGRKGNRLLVNGRVASSMNLDVDNGEPVRWRVVNVANTTFSRLDVNDAETGFASPLWQVGTDGGLLRSPVGRPAVGPSNPEPQVDHGESLQGIFLTPGERIDVVFTPRGDENSVFTVIQKDWRRGLHAAMYNSEGIIMLPDDPLDGIRPPQDYFTVTVRGSDPGGADYVPPAILDPFTSPDAGAAVGTLAATFGHTMPDADGNTTSFAQAKMVPDGSGGMMMMGMPASSITSFDAQDVNVGQTWIWQVTNMTHMDHPFHTHGFFFYPYEIEYVDQDTPENNFVVPLTDAMRKDTIRVPARPGAMMRSNTIMRAVVMFDDTGREGRTAAHGETATSAPDGTHTSGGWLFHCHILEHSARGMLSFIEVHEPADPFWLVGSSLAGEAGKPSLTADGALTAGSPLQLEMVNARPSAPVWLVGGLAADREGLFSGTLVPRQGNVFVGRVTDGAGNGSWTLGWPASIPSGTSVYVQAVIGDPAAPEGVALSNAIQINVP